MDQHVITTLNYAADRLWEIVERHENCVNEWNTLVALASNCINRLGDNQALLDRRGFRL